ncbi:MAG: 50S ribosomal protein L20 [Bacteroidales bacterium]|nr:50S ribosomal protein L20 [Bacteroidales bacterium]
MPKSVNNVATKARKKRSSKRLKASLAGVKTSGPWPKMHTKRDNSMPTETAEIKSANSVSWWISRINAGTRQYDMSYSQFMGKLAKSDIQLNRKVLADLAMNHPEAFKAVVEAVK